MSGPDDGAPRGDGDPPETPEPAMVAIATVVLYGGMGAAGLIWLWWRDRLSVLPEQAVGVHGPWAASGIGLAAGLALAWLLGRVLDRSAPLRQIAAAAQSVLTQLDDLHRVAFALTAAIGEELFFRLAVQDAVGWLGAVAAYVLLNSSVGGLRLLPITLLHGFVFSGLVEFGYGLLASTTAHAVLDHLTMTRIRHA